MTYGKITIIYLFVATFMVFSAVAALDTADIDRVGKKEVLNQQDLAVIDNFVAAGVQELLNMEDFSTIANVRAEIIARAHSSQPSADIQYNPEFVAAALKNLEKAFADAKKITGSDRRAKVMLNLMIFLDNLNSPRLAELALQMIGDEDATVRYWAVHAVTNQNIIEQFNTGKASAALASTIAQKLAERINTETSPYILAQIAHFGAAVNIPQVQQLLTKIADMRIKEYQTWTVEDVSLDAVVLNLLAERIAGPDKAAMGWRFGQLFSDAIERYIKGKSVLTTVQKEELASVLTQTESRALAKIGILQSGIRRAVEKNNEQALQAEYKDLFGEGTNAGKLGTTLNLEYPNPDGTKRTTPLPLPDPPKATK
jgi:hypothetical protein